MSIKYLMRISRLTVDKLGVKLYDKVSAVIAELIANAYDADATRVTVKAPMGQFLATRAGGSVADKGFSIEVVDDGIGMTPQQLQDFFLVVGAERRNEPGRGDLSPRFERKVMGRKGVGKLAPFGICKTIEVISAGRDFNNGSGATPSFTGYLTSHITLDYDGIVTTDIEPDEPYEPTVGSKNGSYSPEPGTRIILKNFNFRKVPDIDTLGRQLAQRFGISSSEWQVELMDNTKSNSVPQAIGNFDVETMPNTKLTFQPDGTVLDPDGNLFTECTAGFKYESKFHHVTGWMAYSKTPYKDELMAGVRIYCRGKIAAQTAIFNQRAGFTGEHNIRSYLVGELHADWLDEDNDLIQTDRRDILWSDELATAFEAWGQKIVKRIGALSRDPMRKKTLELFLETGRVDNRILRAYPNQNQQEIRNSAKEIAQAFGRTFSRREATNADAVNDLVDLTITVAPLITLDSKMREAIAEADIPLSVLTSLLRTARLAELSSFGKIAQNRIKVIDRLEILKDTEDTNEDDLQQLITDAPWLINPEWAPVTENQTFSSLRREFEKYYEKNTGQPISLSEFRETGKRPDFVMCSQEGTVQIIEIKRPNHRLSNLEMDRIVKYYQNIEAFFGESGHAEFRKSFNDFHITVVCDKLGLTDTARAAFEGYLEKDKLTHMSWSAFFLKSQRAHQDFLREAKRQSALQPAVSGNR